MLSLKLTVIGCWGGYPAKNEATSGYLLEYGEYRVLLDCGSGVLAQLQNHLEPEDLDAIVLSHYDADHVADIGVLQHALLIKQFQGSAKKTTPIYGHNLDEAAFAKLDFREVTKGIAYNQEKPMQVGPLTFTFLRTQHPVPCFAMRIEVDGKSIVYTGDSSYFEELAEFAQDATILLCESNFYADMDGTAAGHMTSKEAAKIANNAGVQLLMLTHLPHFGDINKLKKEASEVFTREIAIARNGLEYQI